jgi:hypothetical protein
MLRYKNSEYQQLENAIMITIMTLRLTIEALSPSRWQYQSRV